MPRIDLPADLNAEEETGFVWALLDEANDDTVIRPGHLVVAGSPGAAAVCEVVDIVAKPAGDVVHLRVLSRAD